jgi:capsule polysaccharide export protein KpsE/RkpR
MNENVENLVLEHLRSIRGDMSKMADYMHTMQAEMTAVRQSLASLRTLQDHDHGDIASLKLRIERIEKRLDLVE